MKNRFGRLSLAIVSTFLLAFSLFGQDLDDVTLTGRVTDSNGLAIVGATVKATLVDTGAERTVVTNDEGRFRLIELKPGLTRLRFLKPVLEQKSAPICRRFPDRIYRSIFSLYRVTLKPRLR